MRKVFIDCGAHCGCTRRKVEREFPGYEIFSFEADPELCSLYPQLINAAVWIVDCKKTFYKFATDGGSSLSKTRADLLKVRKPNYYERQEIEVDCFSLSKFLLTNFTKDDQLLLKLDIEGSEYVVLEDLIESGTISLVKKLFIEWHDVRCGYTINDNKRLEGRIRGLNIPIEEWDAMENSDCIINLNKDRGKFHKSSKIS